jgi:hypothetical protein
MQLKVKSAPCCSVAMRSPRWKPKPPKRSQISCAA